MIEFQTEDQIIIENLNRHNGDYRNFTESRQNFLQGNAEVDEVVLLLENIINQLQDFIPGPQDEFWQNNINVASINNARLNLINDLLEFEIQLPPEHWLNVQIEPQPELLIQIEQLPQINEEEIDEINRENQPHLALQVAKIFCFGSGVFLTYSGFSHMLKGTGLLFKTLGKQPTQQVATEIAKMLGKELVEEFTEEACKSILKEGLKLGLIDVSKGSIKIIAGTTISNRISTNNL